MICCKNCNSQAVRVVEWSDQTIMPLCERCYQAFELGAAYEAEGDWQIWPDVDDYVNHVKDMALDMDVDLTESEARYIIDRAYLYDDMNEAVIQYVSWQLPKDRRGEWADQQRALAMDR